MKVRRKARQRKRKARGKRQREKAEDKAFAMSLTNRCSQVSSTNYPHMEWDGQGFSPQPPAPSPFISVEATMMEAAHRKLGVSWNGSRKGVFEPRQSKGLGDTGCQTCTAGPDFLDQIGCPKSFLIPTSHRINGITKAGLDIIGAVLVRFRIGDRVARQMVHISENIHGLFLSETALKQLGVIHRDFPGQETSCVCICCAGTLSSTARCTDDGAEACVERTATPDRPETIPFDNGKSGKARTMVFGILRV